MDKGDFPTEELKRLEREWRETCDMSVIAQAVALCGWNRHPLPEWCVQPALAALEAYNHIGERGKGTPASRNTKAQEDKVRHDLVRRILDHPMDFSGSSSLTLDEASEIATRMLPHQNVSARTIKASYHKIQRALKPSI